MPDRSTNALNVMFICSIPLYIAEKCQFHLTFMVSNRSNSIISLKLILISQKILLSARMRVSVHMPWGKTSVYICPYGWKSYNSRQIENERWKKRKNNNAQNFHYFMIYINIFNVCSGTHAYISFAVERYTGFDSVLWSVPARFLPANHSRIQYGVRGTRNVTRPGYRHWCREIEGEPPSTTTRATRIIGKREEEKIVYDLDGWVLAHNISFSARYRFNELFIVKGNFDVRGIWMHSRAVSPASSSEVIDWRVRLVNVCLCARERSHSAVSYCLMAIYTACCRHSLVARACTATEQHNKTMSIKCLIYISADLNDCIYFTYLTYSFLGSILLSMKTEWMAKE